MLSLHVRIFVLYFLLFYFPQIRGDSTGSGNNHSNSTGLDYNKLSGRWYLYMDNRSAAIRDNTYADFEILANGRLTMTIYRYFLDLTECRTSNLMLKPISSNIPQKEAMTGRMTQSLTASLVRSKYLARCIDLQNTKAIRSVNMEAAQKIRDASTVLEAKRAGNSVKDPVEWSSQKGTVVEEIIRAKADQVMDFKDKLEASSAKTTFEEAAFDTYWGTGLDITGTISTIPSKWPGENKFGFIVKKVAAAVCGRRLRSVSVPRKGQLDEENQTNLDKFISNIKKDRGKKNAKGAQSK